MAARADSGFVINDGVLLRYEGDAQHVTIPDSVKRIGDAAFMGCSPSISVTPISDSVSAVSFRPDHTAGCGSSLLSVTIPDSVTAIGRAAFAGCSTLVSVTIPDSVASIGYGAFMHCTSLVSLTIPDSVTEIGDDAFRGCTSLVSVTIPDSVVSIGEGAFEGCTSLVSRGGKIDVGDFLGACASGDIETVMRLARDLDPASGRDVLAQGITVAAMSGATEVVEFLQPIADVLGSDSGPRDDSSFHAPDAQNAGSDDEPNKDLTAPQQAPKKSKKDSATPYAAELKALASRDEDAREEAGQTLYDAGETALSALIGGLSARSRESRKWCAGLLKEHARYGESFVRDPQVVEALAARLDDPDWETRRYRAAALGYIGTPDALSYLRGVRDSEDEVTRAAALAGLYAAGDEEAHTQLLEMVADASADGRCAAVMSLDLASKPGVDLDVLRSALSDRSKYVREAAEMAISNLESQGERPGHPDFVISNGVLVRYEGDDQEVTIPDSVTSIGPKNGSGREAVAEDPSPRTPKGSDDSPESVDAHPATQRLLDELFVSWPAGRKPLAELSGPDQEILRLVMALGDQDEDSREEAACALGETGDSRAVGPLMLMLREDSKWVREAAADALAAIGEAAVGPLIAVVRCGRLPVRVAAGSALGAVGEPAVEQLLAALEDEDEGVRRTAAQALGVIGSPRSVEALLSVMQDADSYVRRYAAEALGRIADSRSTMCLLETLVTDTDHDVRVEAARALGKIGHSSAVPTLMTTLGDKRGVVREAAAWALGEIGDRSAVEALTAALDDADEYVRDGAEWALEKIAAKTEATSKAAD